MIRRNLSALALLMLVYGPGAALAAEPAAGRYTMTPTPNGFLRLDTATGAVSLCADAGGTWSCQDIADNSATLQGEIDRLSKENAELKTEIESLKQKGPDVTVQLPSDAEIDRAMGFFEKMLKRFKSLMDQFKKDGEPEQSMPL